MKIIVDMDDVICEGGFLYLINKYLNKSYAQEDFKAFYMQDIIEDMDAFYEFFLKHNLYDYTTLKEGAYEVLERLNKVHEVYICTDYIFKEIVDKTGIILNQKYEYLRKELPFINPRNYIFTASKHMIVGDVKIDDRVINLEGNNKKLLFTAFHNKDITADELEKQGIIRVNNWYEVERMLENE